MTCHSSFLDLPCELRTPHVYHEYREGGVGFRWKGDFKRARGRLLSANVITATRDLSYNGIIKTGPGHLAPIQETHKGKSSSWRPTKPGNPETESPKSRRFSSYYQETQEWAEQGQEPPNERIPGPRWEGSFCPSNSAPKIPEEKKEEEPYQEKVVNQIEVDL